MDIDRITNDAADCSARFASDIRRMYSPEVAAAILKGNLLAFTGAYTAIVGAQVSSDFFFRCAEIGVALAAPNLIGYGAVHDAIADAAKRGGEG